jgi:5'-nucleotidase
MALPSRRLALLATVVAIVLAGLAAPPSQATESETIPLKLLAINDLHGGIDTGRTIGGRPVGGAGYLAAHLQLRAAGKSNVLVVGAGDLVGGSPPVSALLREEPTVRALNAMNLALNTPGNHDFDRGLDEFLRLNPGGCTADGDCFEGARYTMVSANILVAATGQPLLPPYEVRDVGGVRVAFVGAVLPEVPDDVVAGAVDGLEFLDPATAINASVSELEAQGIHAIVVLIHQGGFYDRGTRILSGPIAATIDALDPDVDVVISAHTHQGYVVRRGGKMITQAYSSGTSFADIDLRLDPTTGDVASSAASLVTTYDDVVAPDPAVQAIVDDAERQVAPVVDRVVGVAAAPVTRSTNRAGESGLGDLVADAFRWAAGAQVGLTNSGGLRDALPAGEITWGALFQAEPFGNQVVAMTVTGEQLYTLFNAQWTVESGGRERYRPNQVSGIHVEWDSRRPLGDRIVSLTLASGEPVDLAGRYRIAVNSLMAGGGEGYGALLAGEDRTVVGVDLDALVAYVAQLPQPFAQRPEGRILRQG